MRPSVVDLRVSAAFACGLTAAALPALAAFDVAGVSFETANAITDAEVTSLGYATSLGIAALPSDTSADWTIGTSLGNLFQIPEFQDGYSHSVPVNGAPGTGVTLGQDPGFPNSGNVREIIQLTWGGTHGLADETGDDLAIFEQATSEAFALRVHAILPSPEWSAWFYVPYESLYDQDFDATPTRVDFDVDLGLPGVTVNALEIASLAPEDTVAEQITGAAAGLGRGQVSFGGAAGGLQPARFSGSSGTWVQFESWKFDPDIQYVVGLHDLVPGEFSTISALNTGAGSLPGRAPPSGTSTNVPVVAAAPLLLLGLVLLGVIRGLAGLLAIDSAKT